MIATRRRDADAVSQVGPMPALPEALPACYWRFWWPVMPAGVSSPRSPYLCTVRPGGRRALLQSGLDGHAAHGYPYLVGVRKIGLAAGAMSVAKGSTSACGWLGRSRVT